MFGDQNSQIAHLSKKIRPRISPRPGPIRRAVYIRPRCHHRFISSRPPPLSNRPQWRRRIIGATRPRVAVLDGGQCNCQGPTSPRCVPWKIRMKRPIAKPIEDKCPACNGTGFPEVKQPVQPDHKIYAARCTKCGGKGRISEAAN
jgi:hypothetical protein